MESLDSATPIEKDKEDIKSVLSQVSMNKASESKTGRTSSRRTSRPFLFRNSIMSSRLSLSAALKIADNNNSGVVCNLENNDYDMLRAITAEDLMLRHFSRKFLKLPANINDMNKSSNITGSSVVDQDKQFRRLSNNIKAYAQIKLLKREVLKKNLRINDKVLHPYFNRWKSTSDKLSSIAKELQLKRNILKSTTKNVQGKIMNELLRNKLKQWNVNKDIKDDPVSQNKELSKVLNDITKTNNKRGTLLRSNRASRLPSMYRSSRLSLSVGLNLSNNSTSGMILEAMEMNSDYDIDLLRVITAEDLMTRHFTRKLLKKPKEEKNDQVKKALRGKARGNLLLKALRIKDKHIKERLFSPYFQLWKSMTHKIKSKEKLTSIKRGLLKNSIKNVLVRKVLSQQSSSLRLFFTRWRSRVNQYKLLDYQKKVGSKTRGLILKSLVHSKKADYEGRVSEHIMKAIFFSSWNNAIKFIHLKQKNIRLGCNTLKLKSNRKTFEKLSFIKVYNKLTQHFILETMQVIAKSQRSNTLLLQKVLFSELLKKANQKKHRQNMLQRIKLLYNKLTQHFILETMQVIAKSQRSNTLQLQKVLFSELIKKANQRKHRQNMLQRIKLLILKKDRVTQRKFGSAVKDCYYRWKIFAMLKSDAFFVWGSSVNSSSLGGIRGNKYDFIKSLAYYYGAKLNPIDERVINNPSLKARKYNESVREEFFDTNGYLIGLFKKRFLKESFETLLKHSNKKEGLNKIGGLFKGEMLLRLIQRDYDELNESSIYEMNNSVSMILPKTRNNLVYNSLLKNSVREAYNKIKNEAERDTKAERNMSRLLNEYWRNADVNKMIEYKKKENPGMKNIYIDKYNELCAVRDDDALSYKTKAVRVSKPKSYGTSKDFSNMDLSNSRNSNNNKKNNDSFKPRVLNSSLKNVNLNNSHTSIQNKKSKPDQTTSDYNSVTYHSKLDLSNLDNSSRNNSGSKSNRPADTNNRKSLAFKEIKEEEDSPLNKNKLTSTHLSKKQDLEPYIHPFQNLDNSSRNNSGSKSNRPADTNNRKSLAFTEIKEEEDSPLNKNNLTSTHLSKKQDLEPYIHPISVLFTKEFSSTASSIKSFKDNKADQIKSFTAKTLRSINIHKNSKHKYLQTRKIIDKEQEQADKYSLIKKQDLEPYIHPISVLFTKEFSNTASSIKSVKDNKADQIKSFTAKTLRSINTHKNSRNRYLQTRKIIDKIKLPYLGRLLRKYFLQFLIHSKHSKLIPLILKLQLFFRAKQRKAHLMHIKDREQRLVTAITKASLTEPFTRIFLAGKYLRFVSVMLPLIESKLKKKMSEQYLPKYFKYWKAVDKYLYGEQVEKPRQNRILRSKKIKSEQNRTKKMFLANQLDKKVTVFQKLMKKQFNNWRRGARITRLNKYALKIQTFYRMTLAKRRLMKAITRNRLKLIFDRMMMRVNMNIVFEAFFKYSKAMMTSLRDFNSRYYQEEVIENIAPVDNTNTNTNTDNANRAIKKGKQINRCTVNPEKIYFRRAANNLVSFAYRNDLIYNILLRILGKHKGVIKVNASIKGSYNNSNYNSGELYGDSLFPDPSKIQELIHEEQSKLKLESELFKVYRDKHPLRRPFCQWRNSIGSQNKKIETIQRAFRSHQAKNKLNCLTAKKEFLVRALRRMKFTNTGNISIYLLRWLACVNSEKVIEQSNVVKRFTKKYYTKRRIVKYKNCLRRLKRWYYKNIIVKLFKVNKLVKAIKRGTYHIKHFDEDPENSINREDSLVNLNKEKKDLFSRISKKAYLNKVKERMNNIVTTANNANTTFLLRHYLRLWSSHKRLLEQNEQTKVTKIQSNFRSAKARRKVNTELTISKTLQKRIHFLFSTNQDRFNTYLKLWSTNTKQISIHQSSNTITKYMRTIMSITKLNRKIHWIKQYKLLRKAIANQVNKTEKLFSFNRLKKCSVKNKKEILPCLLIRMRSNRVKSGFIKMLNSGFSNQSQKNKAAVQLQKKFRGLRSRAHHKKQVSISNKLKKILLSYEDKELSLKKESFVRMKNKEKEEELSVDSDIIKFFFRKRLRLKRAQKEKNKDHCKGVLESLQSALKSKLIEELLEAGKLKRIEEGLGLLSRGLVKLVAGEKRMMKRYGFKDNNANKMVNDSKVDDSGAEVNDSKDYSQANIGNDSNLSFSSQLQVPNIREKDKFRTVQNISKTPQKKNNQNNTNQMNRSFEVSNNFKVLRGHHNPKPEVNLLYENNNSNDENNKTVLSQLHSYNQRTLLSKILFSTTSDFSLLLLRRLFNIWRDSVYNQKVMDSTVKIQRQLRSSKRKEQQKKRDAGLESSLVKRNKYLLLLIGNLLQKYFSVWVSNMTKERAFKAGAVVNRQARVFLTRKQGKSQLVNLASRAASDNTKKAVISIFGFLNMKKKTEGLVEKTIIPVYLRKHFSVFKVFSESHKLQSLLVKAVNNKNNHTLENIVLRKFRLWKMNSNLRESIQLRLTKMINMLFNKLRNNALNLGYSALRIKDLYGLLDKILSKIAFKKIKNNAEERYAMRRLCLITHDADCKVGEKKKNALVKSLLMNLTYKILNKAFFGKADGSNSSNTNPFGRSKGLANSTSIKKTKAFFFAKAQQKGSNKTKKEYSDRITSTMDNKNTKLKFRAVTINPKKSSYENDSTNKKPYSLSGNVSSFSKDPSQDPQNTSILAKLLTVPENTSSPGTKGVSSNVNLNRSGTYPYEVIFGKKVIQALLNKKRKETLQDITKNSSLRFLLNKLPLLVKSNLYNLNTMPNSNSSNSKSTENKINPSSDSSHSNPVRRFLANLLAKAQQHRVLEENNLKLFCLLRKYYLFYILSALRQSNRLNLLKRVMTTSLDSIWSVHKANKRTIIKKWRFYAFMKKMAKKKLENLYQNMHLFMIDTASEMASNTEVYSKFKDLFEEESSYNTNNSNSNSNVNTSKKNNAEYYSIENTDDNDQENSEKKNTLMKSTSNSKNSVLFNNRLSNIGSNPNSAHNDKNWKDQLQEEEDKDKKKQEKGNSYLKLLHSKNNPLLKNAHNILYSNKTQKKDMVNPLLSGMKINLADYLSDSEDEERNN
eukprot:CAMPEP_0170537126 /NCGR_PEP_ID=MMETSP0209-20121228/102529_1 /TAXON_ID=665100 ORGANISM="Litonotus pictus, Strain P1" /NCGR_SAMPLE_ID=MMETSP0209 /ASSEMBLY_ACC=CAM_ASM_000301 /LENGTH=3045 /DNA_ID=CAMNT_0010838575 /DNA_START=328 /DNA_END=9467 /DNA_ORIENTATION=-